MTTLRAALPRAGIFALLMGGLVLSAISAVASAATQQKQYGQVSQVSLNRTGQIKSFGIQKSKTVLTLKVTTATGWEARSSQAAVAGLQAGDYTYALYSKKHVASTVEYDVAPFTPGPIENFTGTVTHMGAKGLVVTSLSSGANKKVYTTGTTSYYENEQAAPGNFSLQSGDNITVYAQKKGTRWLALSIDEHTQ